MKKIFVLAIVLVTLIAANAFCLDIEIMMPALKESKKGISVIFASIDKDLSTAAGELSRIDLKGEDARKILSEMYKGKNYVVDCVIVDTASKMAVIEPEEYRKYEGSDISKQAHVIKLLKDKKPIFSDVFTSVEGLKVIDFAYPIFSDKGEFLGSVNMLVKQQALSEDVIVPLVSGLACKAWIMQRDGLIIYDQDQNQIGLNIFADTFFQPFEGLVSFSRTVAMAKDGAGSYDFYKKGLDDQAVVKKYAVWDTVSLYGTEWRIIVMEADKPAPGKKDEARP